MVVSLPRDQSRKCLANGLFSATGSDGPSNIPSVRDAFRRVRKAPDQDLTPSGGVHENDFEMIAGMTLQQFVGADCAVLTQDKQQEIWEDALETVRLYWENTPQLPNPFPQAKFKQPAMDCTTTTITDLSATLIDQWKGAQP